MRLITSDLALAEVLALGHANRATLAELAAILEAPPSSCQRALEVLLDDGLVVATGQGRSRCYSLNDRNPTLRPVLDLARASIPPREVLQIVGRANSSVEFVGLSQDHVIAVFAKRSATPDREKATEVIGHMARPLGRHARFYDHEDLRRRGTNSAAIRRSIAADNVLVGILDRSLPDRSGRRETAGRQLGRINAAVRLPSRRTLRSLAHRHGVRAFRVFGSAVRTDFRPDSDIDVAVVLDAGRQLDQSTLESLEAELEARLEHDVDLVIESELKPSLRYLLEREAITL